MLMMLTKFSKKSYVGLVLSFILCTVTLIGPLPSIKAEAAQSEQVTVSLLGTSDIHGRFMPWDYALDGPNTTGSLTQLNTIVTRVRAENPNTILPMLGI